MKERASAICCQVQPSAANFVKTVIQLKTKLLKRTHAYGFEEDFTGICLVGSRLFHPWKKDTCGRFQVHTEI